MALTVTIINSVLSFILIGMGAHMLWKLRGGLFSRALTPIVISWILLGIISSIEIFDTTPRAETLNDWFRFIRVLLNLMGCYALWRIVQTDTDLGRNRNSRAIALVIGVVISLLSLLVIGGWMFSIDQLKAPIHTDIPMKLMTAVLFCMSGALLFVLAYRNKESEHARNIVIASFSAAIFLLIGFSFVNLATGNNLALTPSWVSLVAFLTIAWFGTVSWRKKYTAWESRITGGLLLGLGSFALLGQLFNIPLASTATGIGMPFHSAFMSLLLGIGFLAIQE